MVIEVCMDAPADGDAAEQRARRLALEAEIPFIDRPSGPDGMPLQHEPVVRYVERKVYTPMPPKYITRLVVRERIIGRPVASPAGFFGRLGDRLDGFFGALR